MGADLWNGVVENRSETGSWSVVRSAPPAPLTRDVHRIEHYRETGRRPVVRRELPSLRIPLILVFGPGFSLRSADRAGGPRPLARSFAAGLHEGPVEVGSDGEAACLQVDLTPFAAGRLLRVDMDEICGGSFALADLLGGAAAGLDDRLAEMRDARARIELVERLLQDRLAAARAADPVALAAWRALAATSGRARIDAVARSLGVSRKTLSIRFRRAVGLPPRTVARLVRFDRALDALARGRIGTLADLACACGYADQAHFNRDFRAFAGESPGGLLARTLSDGTGIATA